MSFDLNKESELICKILDVMEEIVLMGAKNQIPLCIKYIEVAYHKSEDFELAQTFKIKTQIFKFYSTLVLIQLVQKNF